MVFLFFIPQLIYYLCRKIYIRVILIQNQDTIIALSTAPGVGAIAVIRLSGEHSIDLVSSVFSKNLLEQDSHTAHFGTIKNEGKIIDEVVAVIFKGPHSFTGENTVEISCHGSMFIQQEIINLFIHKGARMAKPGEFTMRAFMNGKMDLSQAEAVADLIAAESAASHKMAMNQMRGGFSREINDLREQLIHFASLIELELDFSEEDVEFANRDDLKALVDKILKVTKSLIDSFATGNVIKNGVPVAIIGAPNTGKSTLLNQLLNEDKAIVSSIAGTTRDVVEDTMNIEGIQFRFIDTAGLRKTTDEIENLGIEKSYAKAKDASLVLYLIDGVEESPENLAKIIPDFIAELDDSTKQIHFIINKLDQTQGKEELLEKYRSVLGDASVHVISAKTGEGITELKNQLVAYINAGLISDGTIVSNVRHLEALNNAYRSLSEVRQGLENNVTGDFLAIDIRAGLFHLGEITGTITTDDLLDNIFSKFCIGK